MFPVCSVTLLSVLRCNVFMGNKYIDKTSKTSLNVLSQMITIIISGDWLHEIIL